MDISNNKPETSVMHNGDNQSKIPVFFFDIDNCLYSQSTKIEDLSSELLHWYLEKQLGICKQNTNQTLDEFRKEHGFVLTGLFRHPKVDPMEFNTTMDDRLPLESILKPDPKLHQLLSDIDTSKVRLWLLTNSYITHAKRVVKLLNIEEFFGGVTYCDYARSPLIHKPQVEMFEEAMAAANISNKSDCYFVDDSLRNCLAAQEFGWTSVHFLEEGMPNSEHKGHRCRIQDLEELRNIFPLFFKA